MIDFAKINMIDEFQLMYYIKGMQYSKNKNQKINLRKSLETKELQEPRLKIPQLSLKKLKLSLQKSRFSNDSNKSLNNVHKIVTSSIKKIQNKNYLHKIPDINNLKSIQYFTQLRSNQKIGTKLKKIQQMLQESLPKFPLIQELNTLPTLRDDTQALIEQRELQFQKQTTDVLKAIKKNLEIFNYVYNAYQNKIGILKRLFGWDQAFKALFYHNNELKNMSILDLKSSLGLKKKTQKSTTYFHKLKFFLKQLIKINVERQKLLCIMQKQKIIEEMQEINHLKQQFYNNYEGKYKSSYQHILQQTQKKILNMKNEIRSRNNSLSEIEQKTGETSVDFFYRNQQTNISSLEQLLIKKLKA